MFTGNKCGDTLCREIEAERAATDAHLPFIRQIVACRCYIAIKILFDFLRSEPQRLEI